MPEVISKPKITFCFPHVPLATYKKDVPRFFQQYGVKGVLKIDVPTSKPCDLVKITLHGSILNRIGCGYSSIALSAFHNREENFLNLTDVHQLAPANAYRRTTTYQTPFWFEVPACGNVDHDLCRANQYRLPPSMQTSNSDHATPDDGTFASAEILYELRAFVYQEDILVSTRSQPIQLFALTTTIPPPLASDDFEGEYTCARTRNLRRLFSKNKRLEINVLEPKPIPLRMDGQPDIHALPISCRLQDLSRYSPSLYGTLTWRLKSTTIMSTIPVHSLPTSRQVTLCPFLAEVTTMSQAKSIDLRLCDWKLSAMFPGTWDKTQDLWLTIPQPKDAVPSFFTPLVSRRYSLKLCFRLKGDGNAQFHFEVPIQLFWLKDGEGSPASPCAVLEAVEEVGEQCPVYTK